MENLAYSRKSQPAEWYHVEDCFDENILSRVIQHFPDSKDIPITGKREGANNFRKFASRMHTPVLADMFKEFDGTSAREKFTDITGVDCTHGALRVELCQDSPGFYLEPHIDIPEKLITLQIYLEDQNPEWGTSLYNSNKEIVYTVPFRRNEGWLSHNKSPLVHGVEKKVVDGIRRSVIINYINGNWRDTSQLY